MKRITGSNPVQCKSVHWPLWVAEYTRQPTQSKSILLAPLFKCFWGAVRGLTMGENSEGPRGDSGRERSSIFTYLCASLCSSHAMAASGSSKEWALSSPSTWRLAGNSIAYFIFLMRRRLLTSINVHFLRCTSAKKSGKTATILFPKGMLPLSLLRQSISSLSLKLRNFAINVRGSALGGGSLPDRWCARSTTNVGENDSLPYVSQSNFSRNAGGVFPLHPLRESNKSEITVSEPVLNVVLLL